MAKSSMKTTDQVIATTAEWFGKAPDLPKSWRDVLVAITPWFALIFGVLGVLTFLAGFGILTAFSPVAAMGGVNNYGLTTVAALLWLIAAALMVAAFPGLRAHKTKGWTLLYWSEAASFIGSIIALNIVGGIIGALIAFYLLFQIRSYYK